MLSKKSRRPKTVRFPIMIGVKIDMPMLNELELITEFERIASKSALVRGIINDKIHVYERTPQYVRWKNQRAENIRKTREREESD